MAKEQWDLRSNIKNKPNAQGTLFSGGLSQRPDEKRYPRGYTPERMREVTNAVQFPDTGYGRDAQRDYYRQSVVKAAIARSTIPVGDLQGLTMKVLPYKGHIIGGGRGVYEPENRTAMVMQHASDDQTPIHEIGHHVSHLRSGEDRYGAGTPTERGAEEGFADRYADEHFRDDPSAKKKMLDDPRRGLSDYEPTALQTRNRQGQHRAADFKRGYNKARPMETRVPNQQDLAESRGVASMDAFLAERDRQPRLF